MDDARAKVGANETVGKQATDIDQVIQGTQSNKEVQATQDVLETKRLGYTGRPVDNVRLDNIERHGNKMRPGN